MADISIRINGESVKDEGTKKDMNTAMFMILVENLREKVSNVITAEEAAKILIDVSGTCLGDLTLRITGPSEIVKKIKNSCG